MKEINRIIQEGFKEAEEITKQYAKTFYFASRFLPSQQKKAAYAVYAICRITDNAVDDDSKPDFLENINKVKKNIDATYNNEELNSYILFAFRETINKYNIPKHYFDQLIEGMYMDLEKNRYHSFDQLYTYCYRVAGVVGLIMLKIFGYKDTEAEKYAADLGVAMQLTNILRDIKEDFQRGRVYLPQDEMATYNLSESHILRENVDDQFASFLRFQIRRARKFYDHSRHGITKIPSLRSRFVVCVMKELYAAILNAIERNRFDVFSRRAHVNTLGKLWRTSALLFRGDYL